MSSRGSWAQDTITHDIPMFWPQRWVKALFLVLLFYYICGEYRDYNVERERDSMGQGNSVRYSVDYVGKHHNLRGVGFIKGEGERLLRCPLYSTHYGRLHVDA